VSPTIVLLGVPPKPPGVHANNRISREAIKRDRLWERVVTTFGWGQIKRVTAVCMVEARPAAGHMMD